MKVHLRASGIMLHGVGWSIVVALELVLGSSTAIGKITGTGTILANFVPYLFCDESRPLFLSDCQICSSGDVMFM